MRETNETTFASSMVRVALSLSWIVVMRFLLLFLAAGAFVVAIAVGLRNGTEAAVSAKFVCPMHPEVRSTSPGTCPICRMALEPVAAESATDAKHPRGLPGMPDMTAFENVRRHKIIDFVRVHSLVSKLREMRGPASVESNEEISAVLYNDQIDALSPRERGTFSLTASPTTAVAVTRVPGAAVPWDGATSVIRFRVDGPDAAKQKLSLRVGQAGWLQFTEKPRAVVGVPSSAVLQAPEGPYVVVVSKDGGFEKRPIEIGENFTHQGFAVVLGGLHANDLVVARATFFVDADRKLGEQESEKVSP